MVWKFTNDQPVYLQLTEQIRAAILSGEFAPGQKFPPVRELAIEAKINPNTVQHAIAELEQSRLLVTEGTAGRFVTEDQAVLAEAKKHRLNTVTAQCLARFAALGVDAKEAAGLLLEYDAERTDA